MGKSSVRREEDAGVDEEDVEHESVVVSGSDDDADDVEHGGVNDNGAIHCGDGAMKAGRSRAGQHRSKLTGKRQGSCSSSSGSSDSGSESDDSAVRERMSLSLSRKSSSKKKDLVRQDGEKEPSKGPKSAATSTSTKGNIWTKSTASSTSDGSPVSTKHKGSSSGAASPSAVNSGTAPKKQDGFVTKEAAAALLSSCQLTRAEFHDFVCARSFDVFSGGMYRKFLVQSRAAKEAWAFNVQSSICKMQKLGKLMVCVINALKLADASSDKKKGGSGGVGGSQQPFSLGLAMGSCANSSTPPVVRQVNAVRPAFARCCQGAEPGSVGNVVVRCCVTGVVLEDQCVEVRACSKAPPQQQQQQQSPAAAAKRNVRDDAIGNDGDNQAGGRAPGSMLPPHYSLNPL